MTNEELLELIDSEFKAAGMQDHWVYQKQLFSLLELNQLDKFHISGLDWFPGADRVLELVDLLHTEMTPKSEFISLAKKLDISINPNESKNEIATKVKEHKNWRSKAFDLYIEKQFGNRKAELQPLYKKLEEFGYKTELLPRQTRFRMWEIDAINRYGQIETIYLNEGATGKILVQSSKRDYVGVIENLSHLLCKDISTI